VSQSAGAAPDAPRLLFLSPVVPAPLDRGQNVRISSLLLGLARSFRVTLVVPEGPGLDVPSPVWTAVEQLVAVPARQRSATVAEVIRFTARYRVVARPTVVARLLPTADALDGLDLDRYAALWVERAGMARLVKRASARTVLDLDDLEHRLWARDLRLQVRARSVRGVLRPLFNAGQASLRELFLSRRFAAAAVSSATDQAYLRRRGIGRAALVPNGPAVDPTTVRPRPTREAGGPPRAVFLGNLGYGPNVDALVWFDEAVRPELERLGVHLELTVVGPGVTDELVARFPAFRFRGFVPDLVEELQSHDVALVPLRVGGGTKLKVLDLLAAGLPVVTTSVGAEGLNVRDGEHVLIADAPDTFAAAVARLLDEPLVARDLGCNGSRRVRESYSWGAVQAVAVDLIDSVRG
jgi:glycosyltransferase involved in cell wall biosynthesis